MKDDLADFERIYDAHSGFVRQVLFRYLGAEDLDDAVQDCFLKIWNARVDFRSESQLRTWMYKIATNHAFDVLRARATRGPSVEADFDQLEGLPSRDRSLEVAVHDSVRTLPREYRAVIIGVIFQEMALSEVAAALEVPIGTVKSRLSRGRELLKQDLKRKGYFHE